jgi:hypothetical protein
VLVIHRPELCPTVFTLLPSTVARAAPALRLRQQKRLTATDNDRPENFSPGHLSRGTHLRVCIFLMRYHRIVVTPLPRRPCNPRDACSRTTLTLSQVSNKTVKKKASGSPPFCAFYFGRAAGSAAGRLIGRVNARRRDPQTRCRHQSFPDFVLTRAADEWMRHQQAVRDHASQAFRPPRADAVEYLREYAAARLFTKCESEARGPASFGLRLLLERVLFQDPNAIRPIPPGLQS